jgi:hypothetical protein
VTDLPWLIDEQSSSSDHLAEAADCHGDVCGYEA